MKRIISILTIIHLFLSVNAKTYYISNSAIQGNGSKSNPFNNFSTIRNLLVAGDTLFILPGDYYLTSSIEFYNAGIKSRPIVIRAFDLNKKPNLFNKSNSSMIEIESNFQEYDGLNLNGQYTSAGIIKIKNANNIKIQNCKLGRCTKDGLYIYNSNNTIISKCEIYNCLAGSFTNKIDAHGISAQHSRNLRIKECNIHHISGDCFQTDPSFEPPLWDSIFIENSKLWTGRLTQDEAGFKKGEIPGENAIDTKTDYRQSFSSYRPLLYIKNVEAYGFLNDKDKIFIQNRSAFNIKHNVKAIMINCILHDNEIAYSLRGPYVDGAGIKWGGAHAIMINCIAYNNYISVWLNYNIAFCQILNCTFDKNDITYCFWNKSRNTYDCGKSEHFKTNSTGYNPSGFKLENCVFVGSKPSLAISSTNRLAFPKDFRNYTNHDYYPIAGSTAIIDKGKDLSEVTHDIIGTLRKKGAYDSGAYEFVLNAANSGITEEVITIPKESTVVTVVDTIVEMPNFDTSGIVDSGEIAVEDEENENEILEHRIGEIYPNPTRDNITFNSNNLEVKSMEIFNQSGVCIKKISTFDDNEYVDISNLHPGVYFIRISVLQNDMIYTRRFIKI